MNKPCRLGSMLLALAVVVVSGCATKSGETAKTPKVVEKESPVMFERVMKTFVDRGARGDIDGMVSLTSKVTIAQMGMEPLKDHYAKDIVGTLKGFPKMAEGGRTDPVDDGKGTAGWVFKRVFTAANGEEAKVQFIVLKEQGRIGVGYVGFWK